MRKTFLRVMVVLAWLVFCFSPAGCCRIDYGNVSVQGVIDGDTIELSGGKRVRYIGIDCPETRRKTEAGWIEVNEPFAAEAKVLNEQLVKAGPVRFEFDVEKTDKYGRLLVYCFSRASQGEVFIQEELLRRGLAYLYTFPPNVKYVERFVAAAQEAKTNHRGVWSQNLLIASGQAKGFIGHRKMVRGHIRQAEPRENLVRLWMEGLLIVIFRKDLEMFQEAGIDPARDYAGKEVSVFGLIKKYRGKTEIIVSHPSQIEILD